MRAYRFADKYAFKNLYLDSIGEPQDSPRRSSTQGLQINYTLNAEGPADQRIDVFLLDERYERDPLPCSVRKKWSCLFYRPLCLNKAP